MGAGSTDVEYTPEVYRTQEWFDSLDYTDEWNERALYAVFAILGKPKTFLDLGCGNGALVRAAHQAMDLWDIETFAMGVELWLPARMPPAASIEIVEADLRDQYDRGLTFELVTCWEVGEHLPEESAETLCDNIARHVAPGGHLVFTAAPPGQGGDYHVNEQGQSYWSDRLEARGLTYDAEATGRIALVWQWATGPCFWLPQNVQVFGREG